MIHLVKDVLSDDKSAQQLSLLASVDFFSFSTYLQEALKQQDQAQLEQFIESKKDTHERIKFVASLIPHQGYAEPHQFYASLDSDFIKTDDFWKDLNLYFPNILHSPLIQSILLQKWVS